jgi:hypothetical protein
VDGDLAFFGKITGSTKKKFGLIPTDSVQGSLSQIIPVRSGQHDIRVRIEPDDAAMQEDSISGGFAHNSQRDLSVSARQSGLSLSWQGTGSAPLDHRRIHRVCHCRTCDPRTACATPPYP